MGSRKETGKSSSFSNMFRVSLGGDRLAEKEIDFVENITTCKH